MLSWALKPFDLWLLAEAPQRMGWKRGGILMGEILKEMKGFTQIEEEIP